MTIHESGSTNAAGYDIQVFADGSAFVSIGKGAKEKTLPPGTLEAKTLGVLLKGVGDVSALKGAACAKSASFGTTTTITVQGKTSGDLQCPAASWTAGTKELVNLVLSIEHQSISESELHLR
jgi:hypothetical protein